MAAEVSQATPCWINRCVERKREERWLWDGTKPDSKKRAENLTICWVRKVFFMFAWKRKVCFVCTWASTHAYIVCAKAVVYFTVCVWVDPDDSRGKLSVREGQLRQAEGWAAAASGLGHSLFMVQAWAFTDHCHSLSYTHICTDYFIPSLYMIEKDWEGEGKEGMKRKGEKEKVKNGC